MGFGFLPPSPGVCRLILPWGVGCMSSQLVLARALNNNLNVTNATGKRRSVSIEDSGFAATTVDELTDLAT
jgi:hypothetical protein